MPLTVSLDTYFSPDDDLKTIFLDYIKATSTELRFADYGFHMPLLTDSLIQLQEAGKDVAGVLDSIQEHGRYEHPEVVKLHQVKMDLAIGTSKKHHIMHDKFAVRDKRFVLAGSWNFSESATSESNFFFIIDSPELAAKFLANWQEMHDWILANEPQYQNG